MLSLAILFTYFGGALHSTNTHLKIYDEASINININRAKTENKSNCTRNLVQIQFKSRTDYNECKGKLIFNTNIGENLCLRKNIRVIFKTNFKPDKSPSWNIDINYLTAAAALPLG